MNTARVRSRERDRNESNNAAAVSVVVSPSVDLLLAVSDTPDPVVAGDLLTYSATVSNASATAATGVVLTHALPKSVTFESSNPPGCAPAVGVVTCSLGTIIGGGATAVSISVRAGPVGSISNDVRVTSNEGDSNPSNNAVIGISTTISARQCPAGSRVRVSTRPVAAERLEVTLTTTSYPSLPSNAITMLRFGPTSNPTPITNAAIDAGDQAGRTSPFNVTLPGRSQSARFVVRRVTPGLSTFVPFTVVDDCGDWVTFAGAGAAAWGNTQTVTASSVTTSARVGDNLTSVLMVTNSGEHETAGATLVHTIPSSTSLVLATSSRGAGCTTSQPIVCDLGNVEKDGTATVTIVVRANAVGTVKQHAYAESNAYDRPDIENGVVLTTIVNPSGNGPPNPLPSARPMPTTSGVPSMLPGARPNQPNGQQPALLPGAR